jgi:hypothetical protein
MVLFIVTVMRTWNLTFSIDICEPSVSWPVSRIWELVETKTVHSESRITKREDCLWMKKEKEEKHERKRCRKMRSKVRDAKRNLLASVRWNRGYKSWNKAGRQAGRSEEKRSFLSLSNFLSLVTASLLQLVRPKVESFRRCMSWIEIWVAKRKAYPLDTTVSVSFYLSDRSCVLETNKATIFTTCLLKGTILV